MTKEGYQEAFKRFLAIEGFSTLISREIELWVVGKNLLQSLNDWEFVGVFDSEVKAVAICRTYQYFVGPARLNEALPDETCEWTGAYYPIKKDE